MTAGVSADERYRVKHQAIQGFRTSSGSLAMFTAIRRASSLFSFIEPSGSTIHFDFKGLVCYVRINASAGHFYIAADW
jgi:hypothetical protein